MTVSFFRVPRAAQRASSLALLSGALASASAPTIAQSAETVPTGPVFQLPTQYVTARKRVEDVDKVPIGATVVASPQLEEWRVQDVESVLRLSPNVGFSSLGDGRSTYMSIRGIGPMAQPLGRDDTSIVVYVDGVPQPLFAADQGLLDVDRVEILRGPQGTLFGRNAQGGAINFITRKPGETFEAETGLEIGTHGYRRGRAYVSGPLVEGLLSGSLGVSYKHFDGDVDNRVGSRVGYARAPALRGTLVATPGADTSLTFSFHGQRDDNVPANFVLKQTDAFPVVALDPRGFIERKLGGAALTAEHRLGSAVFTSVTAFNHYGYDSLSNNSEALTFAKVFGMPASAFLPATDVSTYDENQNTLHQEFRLSSLPGSRRAWVVGLNYYRDDYHLQTYYRSPFFAATNGWRDQRYTTDSYAAFGETTVPLDAAARWKATAGLRYTHERTRFDGQYLNNGFVGNVAAFTQQGSQRYDLLTGRASLSYDWSPTSMVFVSAARGAKSGGYPNFTNNAVSGQADEPYSASTSWSFELGAKNRLLDERLSLNASLFYNDVKNENLTALDSASFTFAPKSIDTRSYGAEAELRYRATRSLELMSSLGYTHARLRNVSADVAAASGAANGHRVPAVPAWNAALGVSWRTPAAALGVRDAVFYANAQYQFIGSRAADVGDNFELDSYGVVNARIGLDFDHLDVYLFGQNLSDARPQYIGLNYGPGASAVTVGAGRVFGAGITLRH